MLALVKIDVIEPVEKKKKTEVSIAGWIIGHDTDDLIRSAYAAGHADVAKELQGGDFDNLVGKHQMRTGHWILSY